MLQRIKTPRIQSIDNFERFKIIEKKLQMRNIKHNSLLILTFFIFAFSANAQHKTVEEVEGKAVGETVENFIATDADGNTFNLKTALKEGPVILLFYRGQWCPVCNHHLSQLQENLDLIKKQRC